MADGQLERHAFVATEACASAADDLGIIVR
jgi:hypothetical protein